MSVFDKISVIKMPTPDCSNWAFEMEGVRITMHDMVAEINQDSQDFDSFCDALNKVSSLIENIDWNAGKFDSAVHELVDYNGELAQCLGIMLPYSFATEEDKVQAANETKAAIEDPTVLERAWNLIKKFFVSIWKKIVEFFQFIANGFQSNIKPKIEMAQRNWEAMSPEERKLLLTNTKTNLSLTEFKDRAVASIAAVGHIEMCTQYTTKDLLFAAMADRSPVKGPLEYQQLYPLTMLRLVEQLGYKFCDFMGRTPDAINPMNGPNLPEFTARLMKQPERVIKPLLEQGYSESSVDEIFRISNEVANRVTQMANAAKKLKDDLGAVDLKQLVRDNTKRMPAETFRNMVNNLKIAIRNLKELFNMYVKIFKDYFVTNNKILDLFKLSENERKKKYPQEETNE